MSTLTKPNCKTYSKNTYRSPYNQEANKKAYEKPLSTFSPTKYNREELFTGCKAQVITKQVYKYKIQDTPYFSPELKKKIQKAQQNRLADPELVNLLKEIADLTITCYSPNFGQCIAISLATGEIVSCADNEFDLLISIQGKKFSSRIFVWKVGSDSFAGWRSWHQQ